MVWLDAEMKRGTGRSTLKLLERFGLAGYSLYLTHVIAINLVNANLTLANLFFQWLITLFSVAIVAWSFYRIVEWPAHKLARAVGRPNRVNKIA